jgi:hypothetical protein
LTNNEFVIVGLVFEVLSFFTLLMYGAYKWGYEVGQLDEMKRNIGESDG